MKDERKTKRQLIAELAEMRQRIAELEAPEAELVRAEEALRESEERYRSLFNGVPVGLYRTTPAGQILDVNQALLEMLGFPDRETALGINATEGYANPEDRARWQALMDREGVVRGFEAQWCRRDGTVIWMEESARVVQDDEGRVLYYEGAVEDITERKRAEEEIRRFKTISDRAGYGVGIIDLEGNLLYVNESFAQMHAYTAEELIGKHFSILHTEEQMENVERLRKQLEQIGSYVAEEVWHKRKDGTVFPTLMTGTSMTDDEGTPLYLSATATDITERKRAEEALRESEERFRTIVETAPSLLQITDAKGNNLYVSPNCEEITGYTQEELQGEPRWWVHEDDMPRGKEVFERTFREGVGGKDFEYKAVKKNGELWYASSSWESFRDAEGKLQGVVFQTTDITERKRAEEALQESEERYRTLLEFISDSVYVLDYEWRHVIVNDAATRFVQMPKETLLGSKLTDLFPGVEKTEFFRVFQRVMETRKPDTVVNEYTFEDGRKGWYEVHVYPVPAGILCISADITERKRVEEEIAWLAKFPSENPNAVLRVTGDGTIIYANRASLPLLNVWGCQEGQPLPDDWREFISDALSAGSSKEAEVQVEDRVLSLTFGPVVDAGYVNVYGLDITERKRAEEALRESEERLSNFMDSATDGFMLWDSNLDLVEINKVSLEAFPEGTRKEDITGKNITRLVPRIKETDRYDAYRKVLETGEAFFAEDVIPDPKFGNRHLSIKAFKVGDGLGLIGSDITERKRAEEALKKSEEKFRSLAEQSPNMIFINKKGKVVYANQRCEEVTGYTREQFYSPDFDFLSLLAPESIETVKSRFSKHLKGEEVEPYEHTLITKDGERIEAISNTRLIDYEGERAILGIETDITERKRAEEQIKAALAEKEVLLREIHHRVKNNLQALIYLMDMQAETVEAPQALQTLAALQGRTRAMALVHERLYQTEDLARIDFGGYLEDLTANLLYALGGGRDIALRVDAADLFINVNSAIPCGLIVNELVTNALKYAFPEDGDRDRDRDREICVVFESRDGEYVLVVSDNGVGLPPELDWRATESLGLKLVDIWATYQLGGSIELDTRQGTAFTVKFSEW